MPRPKKENGTEPKKRSRTGCWPCKARKVKCGEEKPGCANCVKSGETCDYSIRLNWGGRSRKDKDGIPGDGGTFTFVSTPTASSHSKSPNAGLEHVFSAQHIAPAPAPNSRPPSNHASHLPTPEPTPGGDGTLLDPRLRLGQFPAQQSHELPPLPQSLPYLVSQNASPQLSARPTHPSPPTSCPSGDEYRWSPQNSAKRVKLEPRCSPPTAQPSPSFAVPQYPAQLDQSPASSYYTPHSISSIVNTPATPGSSVHSGSPFAQYQQPVFSALQDPPDLRRLSVKSLLSDPSEEIEVRSIPSSRSEAHGYRSWGYDHGFEDLDVPRNDDSSVVQPKSPDLRRASAAVSEVSTSSGENEGKQIAFEPGGYYAEPVPIRIPKSLEPLPDELLANQMNLLYFHHFINHTGRILSAHDCPENPFRSILPQLAVRNTQLLHLLLTFSASHRARLLDQPEPASRIAGWMSDVLPALRRAIAEPSSPNPNIDPADPSSLAPLATAIMLASLEVVSPHTFPVSISWQQHLQVAREIIVAKGGLDHLAQKADGARDKAVFFLSRWFAYLDVLGSLSGSQQHDPLRDAYHEDGGGRWLVNRDTDEVYQIDCFFGFSGRCISLLAQVAELAAKSDKFRADQRTNPNSLLPPDTLPQSIRHDAEELKKRFQKSATTVFRGCLHTFYKDRRPSEPPEELYTEELYATNEAFHWAGLIYLNRRVLGMASTSLCVQENVRKVIRSLRSVRRGSNAESCLLFPMFNAGCEAQSPEDRAVFMDRLREVEGFGVGNVGQARRVMETVWATGRSWETLVNGEFIG